MKGMRKRRGGRGREEQGAGCIARRYKSWLRAYVGVPYVGDKYIDDDDDGHVTMS